MIIVGELSLKKCIKYLKEIRYLETDGQSHFGPDSISDLESIIEYFRILEMHILNREEAEEE